MNIYSPVLLGDSSNTDGKKNHVLIILPICYQRQYLWRVKIIIRYYHLWKHFKNWKLYLAYKCGLTTAAPLLFETRSGVLVEVPQRLLQTFKEIFMDECYLAGLKKKIPPGATIIDIGANAGYFTLFAASKYPGASIMAYEPVPVNFAELMRNRNLNKSHRIECFPLAVAGHCGEINLSLDASDSFTTNATMLTATSKTADSLTVGCVTLQKIFDDHRVARCDLLKMDCEGAEYSILYSCTPDVLARVDQIAMEVHQGSGENENIEALDAFLKRQGFQTARRPVGMFWAWRV